MKNHKFYFKFLPVFLVLIGTLVYGHLTYASGIADFFLTGIGYIIAIIVNFLGWVITLIMSGIIVIAQYQDYIYAAPVVMGWKIVRDICNMFFILIVLIIAFATILRIERYSIKQLLKKVIIMAILINFSKTICGLMIDAASVVMMTFVNGFKDMGAAQITQILGIDKMLELSNIGNEYQGAGLESLNAETLDFWDILLVYCLALAYILIAVVVLVSMLGVLLMRMIMLWIYIIISPMAYLASVLPSTNSVASKWWNQFTSYVVTGPILAFFIWLSIAVLTQTTEADPRAVAKEFLNSDTARNAIESKGGSPITTTDFFIGYIVAIGLLVGGLIISKEYGGVVGQSAGWGYNKIKNGAGWAKKQAMRPVQFAKDKAIDATKATGRGAVSLATGVAKGGDELLFGGKLSRTAGVIKDNMSMRGVRNLKDRIAASASGKTNWFGHSEAGTISQAVAQHGFWYDPKSRATYKKNSQGYVSADGKDFTGNEKTDHDLMPKVMIGSKAKAAKLKPRNDAFAKFAKGWHARTMGVKAKASRTKQDLAEVDQYQKDYEGYSEIELKEKYESTTNLNRQRAIVKKAADSGFTQGFFGNLIKNLNSELNDKKINYSKIKTQVGGGRDFHGNQELANAYETAEFDPKKFNWDNGKHVEGLGQKMAAQQVMQEKGIWKEYLETLTPEQSKLAEQTVEDMKSKQQEYPGVAKDRKTTIKENFDRAKSLFKQQPGLMKDFIETASKSRSDMTTDFDNESEVNVFKKLLAKGKISLGDQKISHLDTSELAQILKHSLNALGRERYNAQVNKIDKEGSKEFANKMADASLILAKQSEAKGTAKDLETAFAFRKDFIRLKGDISKAFTKPNGSTDLKSLDKFFANASPKELSEVDSTTMDENLSKRAAAAINYSKLNNLNSRQADNPDLVNKLAKAMVDMNHVEAGKIPMGINNKFIVNIEHVNKNKAIQEVLRGTEGVKAEQITDYDFINQLRTDLEGLSGKAATTAGYYRQSNGGRLQGTDKLKDEVKKRI